MNPLPISFIAEYHYCPRSAYFLLTDTPKARDENVYIQHGRKVHEQVDKGYVAHKNTHKLETSVRTYSEKYHIVGVIDVLEFYPDGSLIPIEFKRGEQRIHRTHQLQLALHALCLQELYPNSTITEIGVFYTGDRKKEYIPLSEELRKEAEDLATTVCNYVKNGLQPANFPAYKDARCYGCCFYHLCYPECI